MENRFAVKNDLFDMFIGFDLKKFPDRKRHYCDLNWSFLTENDHFWLKISPIVHIKIKVYNDDQRAKSDSHFFPHIHTILLKNSHFRFKMTVFLSRFGYVYRKWRIDHNCIIWCKPYLWGVILYLRLVIKHLISFQISKMAQFHSHLIINGPIFNFNFNFGRLILSWRLRKWAYFEKWDEKEVLS